MEERPVVRYFDLPIEDCETEIKSMLDRLASDVGAGRSLDDVLDFIWKQTASLLPRDRMGVAFIDDDGQRVVTRWGHAEYPDVLLKEGYSAGLARSSLARVLETGQARIIGDLEEYLRHSPGSESTRLLVNEGVRCSLTLPLKVADRAVGFIFLSSKKAHAFDEKHARLLLAVNKRMAQAVEKAWLIKSLSDKQEAYFSMLGFIAHELKSPLASIVARAQSYLGGYLGAPHAPAVETLSAVVRITGYMSDMVHDYLDLTRLESQEMRFSPRDGVRFKEDVLRSALELNGLWAGERNATIRVEAGEGDILLRADVELLRIVASNLINNAIKYGRMGGEVLVSARCDGDRLIFSVRNEGVGFTEEQSKNLFKRFSRLRQKGLEDRKGSGLGLYICWFAVQKHGGTVTAKSSPGEWAEFTVELPGAVKAQ
ncbi:MAG: GAF domain-containing sensor histidine kinase [Elusimicrobiota bacterium]